MSTDDRYTVRWRLEGIIITWFQVTDRVTIEHWPSGVMLGQMEWIAWEHQLQWFMDAHAKQVTRLADEEARG